MESQQAIRVCCRGSGNLASKVIVLSGKRQPSISFPYLIVQTDRITDANLRFFTRSGMLKPGETTFVASGTGEREQAETREKIWNNIGRGYSVRLEDKFFHDLPADIDVFVDYTFNAKPFVKKCPQDKPKIVQSNNYGLGTLWVPPAGRKTTRRTVKYIGRQTAHFQE